MARRPISGVARDGVGNIVASATATLTVYSGGAAATCYAAESGGWPCRVGLRHPVLTDRIRSGSTTAITRS